MLGSELESLLGPELESEMEYLLDPWLESLLGGRQQKRKQPDTNLEKSGLEISLYILEKKRIKISN